MVLQKREKLGKYDWNLFLGKRRRLSRVMKGGTPGKRGKVIPVREKGLFRRIPRV